MKILNLFYLSVCLSVCLPVCLSIYYWIIVQIQKLKVNVVPKCYLTLRYIPMKWLLYEPMCQNLFWKWIEAVLLYKATPTPWWKLYILYILLFLLRKLSSKLFYHGIFHKQNSVCICKYVSQKVLMQGVLLTLSQNPPLTAHFPEYSSTINLILTVGVFRIVILHIKMNFYWNSIHLLLAHQIH